MSIGDTPKNPEIVYGWFSSAPCFFRYHILNNKCGTSIQYMNAPVNSLWPKTFWNATPCQNATHHMHNSAILPLTYAILLRRIGCCKLPFDSISLTEICKFM